MWLRPTCVALFLVLWAASAVAAAPVDDGYIEGYAAAILQREFSLAAPSLRVQHGVITLDAADLTTVDQASVVTQLERIPGVARVEVRPAGAPPPVVAPPPPVVAPPPSAAEPPKVVAEWQVGLLPGNLLFKPLIADPRWPHFSASWQHYVGDPQLKDAANHNVRGKLLPLSREAGAGLVGGGRPGGRLLGLRPEHGIIRPDQRRLHGRRPAERQVRGLLGVPAPRPSEQPPGRRVPAPNDPPQPGQCEPAERRPQDVVRACRDPSCVRRVAAFSSIPTPRT